jgi:hypothetical protein
MTREKARAVVSSLALLAVAVVTEPSFAGQSSSAPSQASSPQPPKRTGWVFEVHVGSMPDRAPSKVVTSQLPTPGPSFATPDGNQSRQVPSWYFGDGAALANSVIAKLGSNLRIVPLDPVLTASAVTHQSGANFGARAGHTITSRVLVLFSYDQASGRLLLTPSTQAAIAATNASFKPYFDFWLTGGGLATPTTTSTVTFTDNAGTERVMSVTAEVRIISTHGWTPYVALGGGIALPMPAVDTRVTFVGNYQTSVINPASAAFGAHVHETDQLQVRYEVMPAPIGIFGVGVERDLTRHLGVRAELRSFLKINEIRTRIDTSPISGPTPPPVVVLRGGVNPDMAISTNPNRQTSLSLFGVDHFESSTAVGSQPSFSAGLFFRF